MLNNSSFLSMEPGSIGHVFYYKRAVVDNNSRQKIVDNNVNQAIQAGFNPPPGLSKEDYNNMFLNFIVKERTYNNDLIDDYGDRHSVLVQIGNNECLRELELIENSPGFIKYENPHFVEMIRNPFW